MNESKDFKVEITGFEKAGKKTLLKRIVSDKSNLKIGDYSVQYFIKKETGEYFVQSKKLGKVKNLDNKSFLGFGLVHVIDGSDSSVMKEEYQKKKRKEIKKLTSEKKGSPLLVLISKKDRASFLTCERLYTILELDKISTGMVSIIDCDAVHDNKHVKKGTSWIKNILIKNITKE